MAVGACAALLGGCTTYHPLPLPRHPDLVARVSELRTRIPAIAGHAPPRRIATDRPLPIDEVGFLAVLNDPQLRAGRGEMDSARAGLLRAALPPNPSVDLSYEALVGGIGTSAWPASLIEDARSIPTYHTRRRSARFAVGQVNADLLCAQWQVAQKARLLALELYWDGQALRLNRL